MTILFLNIFWVQLYLPIRMSFEDKRHISEFVAVFDTMTDLLFFIESMMTFFIPILNGEGNLNHNAYIILR
jgi:hypothetical protein